MEVFDLNELKQNATIKEIKRAIEILDPNHRERYESIDVVNKACILGQIALKQFVPINVKISINPATENKYNCPICNSQVDLNDRYCRSCGQAILF